MTSHEQVGAGVASRRRGRDRRLAVIVGGIVGIGALGYGVSHLPDRGVEARLFPTVTTANPAKPPVETEMPFEPLADPRHDPSGHARQARKLEVRARMDEGQAMLDAQRYDEAITAFHRVLELQPETPEAYVNMGFALVGKKAFEPAFDFFMGAIDLDPAQATAYYGMAIVQEGLGNLEGALGGMRTFLHLTNDADPYRLQTARARAAIWEWEARLGRGPWGPTKGVPPGFTEDELRRDGRGVGVKMQIGDPEKGPVRYEIKAGDKIQIYDRP